MALRAIDPWVNVSIGAMADTPFLKQCQDSVATTALGMRIQLFNATL